MSTIVETIEVDEDTRIVVRHDDDAESPLTWGDHVTTEDPAYAAWQAGEVYGVCIERRTQWQRTDMPETTMVTWDEIDAIWSCYLDDSYTARVVAKEYFGVG